MIFPAKLKNFNLHADGDSWAGLVSEIALPKLAKETEEFRNAGMLSKLDAEMGLQKLEMETKLGGFALGALRQFGAIGVAGVQLRYNGAYQEDVAGGVLPAELVVRGMHTEYDPGTAKVGEATEQTVKSTLSYLRWTVGSRVRVEIDVLNCVWIMDGVDRMAAIRAAIDL